MSKDAAPERIAAIWSPEARTDPRAIEREAAMQSLSAVWLPLALRYRLDTLDPARVIAFQEIVRRALPCFIRRPHGRDVFAACGQLKKYGG